MTLRPEKPGTSPILSISAVTLWTKDMARSVAFYRSLGFELIYGGETERFTSLRAGSGYLNLATVEASGKIPSWGRVIFYVEDVDAFHEEAVRAGHQPDFAPRDAAWGERYFHLDDPDGHALSFARPIRSAD
jgi:catechol 2,3-dioxygenase-like lactoylglutathione lyase family enzyme